MLNGNNSSNKAAQVGTYLLDKYGSTVTFQIRKDGGAINLEAGKVDNEGFHIAIDPNTGAEGILYVIPVDSEKNTAIPLPFYKGGWNEVCVREVAVNVDNTASGCYWGK